MRCYGILFKEPNPYAGSRPRDIIGLYIKQKYPTTRWYFSNKRFGIPVKTIHEFLPDEDFTIQTFTADATRNLGESGRGIPRPNYKSTKAEGNYVMKSLDFSDENYKENETEKKSGDKPNGTHHLTYTVVSMMI